MNYTTKNKEVLRAMETIFGQKFANNSITNFSVAYSQHRKLSIVVVQIEGANFYHALILVYTKSLMLYDVVKYYKSTVRKYGILSKYTPPVEIIKKFITKKIPPYNPLTNKKLSEEIADDKTDFRIENLKNQIEQLKNKDKSRRYEIKTLRDKIKLMRKKK